MLKRLGSLLSRCGARSDPGTDVLTSAANTREIS